MEIYLVGGAVRDKLLGIPHRGENDWVVVGSTESEVRSKGFKKVGKDFPVFLHPETHEEYALARTERKKAKGYYGFECHASPDVTLEQDLSRRDLTINAIAEKDGQIFDPFNGQQDIKDRILRHVSPAFSEDPVRILRLARFASRFVPMGFRIADETMDLMRTMVESGEVDALVPERVWQEMERALKEEVPSLFFMVLHACGALQKLWPSLDKLWGIPQPEKYHPEIDTGVHTMMTVNIAAILSDDAQVRFAALCHDLGKGETPPNEWPSHRGHEEKGVPLIEEFCDKFRLPKEYRDLAVLVSRFHLHCHKVDELRPATLLKVLERLDAFRRQKRFEKFLLSCEADARGRTGLEAKPYPQADKMRQAFLAAKEVSIKEFMEDGLEGELLKQKLHQVRAKAIARAFKQEDSESDADPDV